MLGAIRAEAPQKGGNHVNCSLMASEPRVGLKIAATEKTATKRTCGARIEKGLPVLDKGQVRTFEGLEWKKRGLEWNG